MIGSARALSSRLASPIVGTMALLLAGLAYWAASWSWKYSIPQMLIYIWTDQPFRPWYETGSPEWRARISAVGNGVGMAMYPMLVAVLFWSWCRPLRAGSSKLTRRTFVPVWASVGLSAAYWLLEIEYALGYHSIRYLVTTAVQSVLVLCAAIGMFVYASRHESWWAGLVARSVLMLWVCLLAFPWLGELI